MSGTAFTMDTLIYAIGSHVMYFNKYNINGKRIWTKSFGGKSPNSFMIVNRMKCDDQGNVYMCGNLSPVAGDTIIIGNYRIPGRGAFIAKFNRNGDNIWCTVSEPSGITGSSATFYDMSVGINVLYTCGEMSFGKLKFGNRVFKNKFSNGALVCGLNLINGNVFTSRLLDTTSANQAFGIEVSKNNKVYVVGGYLGPGDFIVDALSVPFSNLNVNSFVLQTDLSLKGKWLINGTTYTSTSGVTGSFKKALSQIELDRFDNIYATGNAPGDSTAFGNISFAHETSTPYKQDLYVVKFTRTGVPVWIKPGRSRENDFVNDIITDPSGNSIIAVGSGENATGGLIFGNDTIPQRYSGLVKYDAAGNIIYTKALQESQSVKQMSSGPNGSFVITGNPFRRGRPFDTILINDCENKNNGSTAGNSMFMAGFAQTEIPLYAKTFPDKNLSKIIKVYPNPTAGLIQISYPEMKKNETVSLSIFSRDNRLMIYKPAVDANQVVDVSGLQTGYYICHLQDRSGDQASVLLFKE